MTLIEKYELTLAGIVVLIAVLIFIPRSLFPKRVIEWSVIGIFIALIAWLAVVFGSLTLGGSSQTLSVTELRPPAKGRETVVFLFGWNGDDDTWGQFPRLLLDDQRFQGYGVAKFSYRSRPGLEGKPVEAMADDTAKLLSQTYGSQPLFILAHSMGGVLVRQIIAQKAPSLPIDIKRFIAVASPFKGADIATLMKELGMTPATLADLSPGSPFLGALDRRWVEIARTSWQGLDVCVPGRLDRIASIASATHECTWSVEPLELGHVDIVKPTSAAHPAYVAITRIISWHPQ